MKRVNKAIRQIKLKDFLAPLIFVLMLIPSLFFRLYNKIRGRELWLVAEEGDARDNGYHFYSYVRKSHPNDFCFYAVKSKSFGYKKIRKLGNVIEYGSLRHWIYYMSADLNISSQKSGNPCPIFWYFIHVVFGLYRNRVFLQHGITHNSAKWLYYNKTKFRYFVCGIPEEYNYIKEKFGYPGNSLLLTGFPRWDALLDLSKKQREKKILIMPTWRNWLGGEKNALFEIKDFEKTTFYKCWNGLLNNQKFIEYIESNNIRVYFYPHINMQKFINTFNIGSKNIEVVLLDQDIQSFFNCSNLMITDYSSVAFDFAYLGKPVIYYQFDKEEYRKRQYQEGYFSYEKDGFGPVVLDEEMLVRAIVNMCSDDIAGIYTRRINNSFFGQKFKEEFREIVF